MARFLSDLFGHLPPEQQLATDDFTRLKQELDKMRPALQEARKLAALPRGRHRLEYKPLAWETPLPDQQETWRIVFLLCYDAMRHDQECDPITALNSCRAAFHAARSLGDEPDYSQMLRMEGVILSCQSIERVLAQGEPPPEQLADLQNLLRREDNFPSQPILVLGMRALLHSAIDALESGAVPLSKLQGMFPPKLNRFLDALPNREELRQSHPTVLAVMNRYVAIARLPPHEQPEALKQFDLELRSLKQSDPLAFDLIPPLSDTFDACHCKHVYLRCMDAALAAERYRRHHKQWPQSLDKLGPQLLAAVPLDPFDGKPLRYRRVEDGVIIYSVSGDRADNNGKLDRGNPRIPGTDIGVRLWDVAQRRQPPKAKTA